MGVGIDSDTRIDTELQRELRRRFGALQESFRSVHPGVKIETVILPASRIEQEMRNRSRSGLSPDLLLIEGATANRLHQLGLTRSLPFPSRATDQLRPELIERVRVAPGELVGLPQALTPQLACFDRGRLTLAPSTLEELVAESTRGRRMGIGMDLTNLAWTLGALGALDAIAATLQGAAVTTARREAIARWLLWLRTADLQQRITLSPSQEDLNDQLTAGELDWITCRSTDIRHLRETLGPRLGLAPLPGGPAGPPTPVSRMRVLAFGTNSSASQRRIADALASFATNAVIQRALMLRTRELLPANRQVRVPVEISSDLAALVAAEEQASSSRAMAVLTHPRQAIEPEVNRILTRFLYGELEVAEATAALIATLRQSPAP
jgi:hypothetical protein